jgi:hypothetical protein
MTRCRAAAEPHVRRMIRPRAKTYAAIVLVVLPFVLDWLTWNSPIGLVGLLLYNVYYLPLSWIGGPFFSHAAEIGVVPHLPGRVLAAVFYSGVVFLVFAAWGSLRLHRRTEGTN